MGLNLQFDHKSEEKVVVGIDGTGKKVTNRGEWIRHKWKVMVSDGLPQKEFFQL